MSIFEDACALILAFSQSGSFTLQTTPGRNEGLVKYESACQMANDL
jgi:hypothetical protein